MVQGVSLDSYAKFPPNRTVIFFVFDVFLGGVLGGVLTFVLVGFGGNLVQWFRVYP